MNKASLIGAPKGKSEILIQSREEYERNVSGREEDHKTVKSPVEDARPFDGLTVAGEPRLVFVCLLRVSFSFGIHGDLGVMEFSRMKCSCMFYYFLC